MQRIYLKSCDWGERKKNGERKRFKKCGGNVFRILFKSENKKFDEEFKIKYVEVCNKCDALHQIWKEGELEELEKLKDKTQPQKERER